MPRHPFYLKVIAELDAYNHDWLLPYVTVMYSTGPLFLSALWEEYIAAQARQPPHEHVWVLSRETHYEDTYGFFNNHDGSSWHGRDMAVIVWIGQHLLRATVFGLLTGFAAMGLLWWIIRKAAVWERGRARYKPIMTDS